MKQISEAAALVNWYLKTWHKLAVRVYISLSLLFFEGADEITIFIVNALIE